MPKLLEKILEGLENINSYELNQTDSYTNQSQLLFLIATIILGTSFLSIASDDRIVIISKMIIFLIVIVALYYATPYLRNREYNVFPKLDELDPYIVHDDNKYTEFIERLIEYRKSQYEHNRKLNLQRESDFRICVALLFISIILIFLLFAYYFVTINKISYWS